MSITDGSAPHSNWERIVPIYRSTRAVHPSSKIRHRFEQPFAKMDDPAEWQYGEKPVQAREEITTTSWPHPSFHAVNYSAERVLQFFNSRMKSRLPRTPWRGDRIVLEDGLTGAPPNIAMNSGVTECPTA
jgi:hypothetical protein